MQIITSVKELKKRLAAHSGSVGFVPTMGALHEGHLSLIRHSIEQNDITVVSIFVNPTQFLEGEDLQNYPRRTKADSKICEVAGVNYLFMPPFNEIYGEDEASIQAPKVKGYILEGATRPGHFSGVLTVVMKLLNITNPTRAYFGKKDAQQLYLIQKMVREYFMDVQIVAVDTVRQSNALALSSRNSYLSQKEQEIALKIPASLNLARKLIASGVVDSKEIVARMQEVLEGLRVEYIAVVDYDFNYKSSIELGDTIILVEAIVGTTRLLDNIWI